MRLTGRVKSISYVKANAAEILEDVAESREPFIITQNGEAKAVLQDLASYEATQETLALLKIIALAREDVAAGRTKPFREVIERLRSKRYDAE